MKARTRIARNVAAGALLLGGPAVAVSSSRHPVSGARPSMRFVSHSLEGSAPAQPAPPPEARSLFNSFGSASTRDARPVEPSDEAVDRVLDFLRENNLLRTDVAHPSDVSGDLLAGDGRKSFAHASVYSHCHTYYASWNTAQYPTSSADQCVNVWGGEWHTREAAPLVDSVTMANQTATGFDLHVDMNQSSTVHVVVLESSSPAPSSLQVKNGTDGAGLAAVQWRSAAFDGGDYSGVFSFSGLNADKYYIAYVVGESAVDGLTPTPSAVNNAFDTGLISNVGTWKFPKTRVDANGNFYVAHSDSGTIRFLRWDGTAFVPHAAFNADDVPGRTHTGWGNANRVDYELDAAGHIHVVFSAGTSNWATDQDPFYGYYDGSSWTFTNIGETGYSVDEVDVYLDDSQKVHASFTHYNGSGDTISYATNASGSWALSTVVVAGSGTDEAHDTYVVADSLGTAYVFYRREDDQNSGEDNYYLATSADSFAAQTRILDGKADARQYRMAGVLVDDNDKLHYAYANVSDGRSHYVTNASGGWVSTEITHARHPRVNVVDVQQVGSTFFFAGSSGTDYFISTYDGVELTDGFDFSLNGWLNDRIAVSDTGNRIMVVSENSDGWEIHYHTSTIDGYVDGVAGGNQAPTDLSVDPSPAEVGQSAGLNGLVGTLSSTDADSGDMHTYSLVAGAGDDDNARFNVSGNELRATDAASMAAGSYSVRLRTEDGHGGSHEEALPVAVLDDVAPDGHSVAFNDATLNDAEADSAAFTFSDAEVGASYSYTVTSAGGGIPVTGSGTVAGAGQQVSGIDVSGLSDGTLTLSVVLEDSSGNTAGAVTDTASLDTTLSAPTLSSSESGYVSGQFSVQIAFAEPVSGFTLADMVASNATLSGLSGSGGDYTATVVPAGDGAVTLSVPAGGAHDAAGNGNEASAVFSIEHDGSGPELQAAMPADEATEVAFDTALSLTFDEAVVAGTGSIYVYDAADDAEVEAVPVGSGQVSINEGQVVVAFAGTFTPDRSYYVNIDGGAFQDALGNAFAGLAGREALDFTIGNTRPVAEADTATTAEDDSVDVVVLANDSDTESALNAASVTVLTGPANGSTSVDTGTGVVTYTPEDDFSGSDSFTYTVDDIHGATSEPALVSVTVTPVNDAPQAVSDVASTDEDVQVSIDVSANDTDRDAGDGVDPSTLTITSGPGNGTAHVDAGHIVYVPETDYSGSDELRYTIEDQHGAVSNEATVVVNVAGVNDAPQAADDSAVTPEDAPVSIDVLGNDQDRDGSLLASAVAVVDQPDYGATVVGADGTITYTPEKDFNGPDQFTYLVEDDEGASSNAATVTVSVTSVNDAPVAADDMVTLQEDGIHRVNVLGNDSDVDGLVVPTSVEVVDAPGDGATITDPVTGAITYTPSENFHGEDSFSYRVQDDVGAWSDQATVRLVVQPVNDVPLVNDDAVVTPEDTPVLIDVLGNDNDVDGVLDVATLTIQQSPASGEATVLADGTVRYVPAPNQSGRITFTYVVTDDAGAVSGTASVTVDVTPVDDSPTITGAPQSTAVAGQLYAFTPAVADDDSADLDIDVSSVPGWATFDPATGTIRGTPANRHAGVSADIRMSVSDGTTSVALPAFRIEVLRDTDLDGTPDRDDSDSDGDGMPDAYEREHGFDPLNPADGLEDPDNDGLPSRDEYAAGSDPRTDDQPPAFEPLATIEIDAVGLLTPLPELPAPPAFDARDGAVEATAVGHQPRYAPGTHDITWRARDAAGNEASATQRLDVWPQVSLAPDQVRAEGSTASVRFVLNGYAPSYPFSVDYVVSGTAGADDHDLTSGTVVFGAGQLEKAVPVEILDDALSEGTETLQVRLTGAGNFGARHTHQITIVEENAAPALTLRVSQDDVEALILSQEGGPVTFAATVDDPNPGDEHAFEWQFPGGAQLVNRAGGTRVLDPASLQPGVYQVALQVWDDGSPYLGDQETLSFRIVSTRPALSSDEDSDGDGFADASEGFGDRDQDGQPDYLDNMDLPNVLNERQGDGEHYLVEGDPGLRLMLGAHALARGADGAQLDEDELQGEGLPADGVPNIGGYFDFAVRDVPTVGASVHVVIPQRRPVPEGAQYRKFAAGVWFTFVEDARNGLATASGEQGVCPPPGAADYTPGLTPGDWCVQLLIEDGGPNDADGLANGVVSDPGGVGAPERVRHETRGGGGALGPWALVGLLLLVATRLRRPKPGHVTALLLALALVLPGAAVAETDAARAWRGIYLTGGVGHADTDAGRSSLSRRFAEMQPPVAVHSVDRDRAVWNIGVGYEVTARWALQLELIDLGEVDMEFTAPTTASDLAQVHPSSGAGPAASVRYRHPLGERLHVAGRAGVFRWEHTYETRQLGHRVDRWSDDGLDPFWGIGFGYDLTARWSLGLEMQRFELDDATQAWTLHGRWWLGR